MKKTIYITITFAALSSSVDASAAHRPTSLAIKTTTTQQTSEAERHLQKLRKNTLWTSIQCPATARVFLDKYTGTDRDCIAKALGFIFNEVKYNEVTYNEYLQKFGLSNEAPKSFKMPAFTRHKPDTVQGAQ